MAKNGTPVFSEKVIADLQAKYPETPHKLQHGMKDHPLLDLGALVELAKKLPASSVEYNRAKDLPVGIRNDEVPMSDLSVEETVRSIENNGSWMVLKRIEQDPAYDEMLNTILDEIEEMARPTTGAMINREGFIFISSPGAVTPFHFDPEHNILMQIRGSKIFNIYRHLNDQYASAEAHEAFHRGEQHRNLPWKEEWRNQGQPIKLSPGTALYVPVKAPHWVQNGEEVSISLSVTWRSNWTYAEAEARSMNHILRKTGLNPASPGRYPANNMAKSVAFRALRKISGNRLTK